MSYDNIEFERRGFVGLLTLNRPHRLNALSPGLVDDLIQFFASLKRDRETRIVIMRGAGTSFCTGFDLSGDDSAESEIGPVEKAYGGMKTYSQVAVQMRQAPQPLIAAVSGNAVGAGFSIALACDMRIAGESARFCARMVRLGMSAGDFGMTYFLPRLIGMARASELLYTARWIDAATAEKLGIVSKVVPDDQLDDAVMELAHEVLQNAPIALKMTKELLNMSLDQPSLAATIELEARSQGLCALTEDFQEAVASILEKRDAVWKDR
ncbi:MAG: enoyl-CoA hydratase/isomerase family protein [Chloroflexi bacterium]|nr:enoyl-CoA hydratase/isomerase family protein [Chloroflexota bacterium]